MSLDRDQFWHLYVNANSLSELAIVELGREWETTSGAAPAAAPLTDEQLPATEEQVQARLASQYASADWSALEGLDWDVIGGALQPPQAHAIAARLERAYTPEANLRRQADAAFDRADRAALAAALAVLPPGLPALTARLPADQISRWLDVYRAGTPALGTIVATIRALTLAVGPPA
jgi:hypothetical protein